MEPLAVAGYTLAGAVAGWFLLVRLIESWPEPSALDQRGRMAVAAADAVLWGLVADRYPSNWAAVSVCFLAATLLVVSVIDLRVYRIPDRIVFPSLGAGLVLIAVASAALDASIAPALVGCGVYFLALFVPHLIYPRGMGFGDVKLGLVMGLYLGWVGQDYPRAVLAVIDALFVGCLLGVVFGLAVNLVRRERGHFPFGPALAIGCLLVVLEPARFLPA